MVFDAQGHVYLTSFGSLQSVLRTGDGGSTVVGTQGYIPPEQFVGKATPASDLYALALTIVHAATGVPPTDLVMKRMKPQIRTILELPSYLVELLDLLVEPIVAHRLDRYDIIRQTLQSRKVSTSLQRQIKRRNDDPVTQEAQRELRVPMEEVVRRLKRYPDCLVLKQDKQSLLLRSRWFGFRIHHLIFNSFDVVGGAFAPLFYLALWFDNKAGIDRPAASTGLWIGRVVFFGCMWLFFAVVGLFSVDARIWAHPYATLLITEDDIRCTV